MHSALLAHGTHVSCKTVKRRLTKDFGLKAFKPAKKPYLTPAMKLKRLNFAKKHINWSREQWSRVIFSDESCIQQFGSRKHSVWRPVGKRFDEKKKQQTMKHSPKIMIWGAMSVKGTAGLFFLTPGTTMNGAKYLELLKNKLQLHMNVRECTIFMQDGPPCHKAKIAPCHKAKIVSNFLKSKKIQVLDWPGNSPDLNPIENLWVILKNKVAEEQPSSLKQMENVIKKVWTLGITSEYCCKLIVSMPRRFKMVIDNKGGHTKY